MNATDYDPIEELLPTKGWLGRYMQFTSNLEICARFRFFAACCAMGAVVNNKVWLQRGDEGLLPKLMPNPWVILLAPPGRGHKTTAINMACNLIQQASSDTRVLADKLTSEYLVKALSAPRTQKDIIRIGPRDATGLVKASELSVFFGRQQYNVGLINLITDLYDFREEWKGGTIGRGNEVLRNVCISILGGSTPVWLQQMLPDDAFTGGFMSRFILVEMPPTYFKKIAHPKRPKGIQWSDLVEEMREIEQRSRGEMRWGPGSMDAYEQVYSDSAPTGEAQRDAYREREPEQVIKTAMLLALDRGSLDLTGEDILKVYGMIKLLREEINPRIERLTTHPRMQLVQEMLDLLKVHGALQESEMMNKLYRSLSMGERQFYEAISILRRTDRLKVEGSPGNFTYSLKKKGG